MKKIVILKMGDTLKEISSKYGEFPDHIIKQSSLDKEEVVVIDCNKMKEIINVENIKGIIITGSHSMVTDYEKWSVKVSRWLKNIEHMNIPTLGICYGHQLLADTFGGKVGYNPKGPEFGTSDIYLTKDGEEDELLSEMPKKFKGHEAHFQSVIEVPKDAKILAYNENDSIQAFRYKQHIWGLQFHPEFNQEISIEYAKFSEKNIKKSGKNYEEMYNKIQEHQYGKILFNKFIKIIEENNR